MATDTVLRSRDSRPAHRHDGMIVRGARELAGPPGRLANELVDTKMTGAASMVGHAADHGEEQEEGKHHEQAASTAADHATEAQTETKSEAVFD